MTKPMGRLRGIGLVVGSAAGVAGVFKQMAKARDERDRLLLLNALANGLAVITGLAVGVRALRKERR